MLMCGNTQTTYRNMKQNPLVGSMYSFQGRHPSCISLHAAIDAAISPWWIGPTWNAMSVNIMKWSRKNVSTGCRMSASVKANRMAWRKDIALRAYPVGLVRQFFPQITTD